MTEFITNLFHRHRGTGNLVAPRGHSRFESEVGSNARPTTLAPSETEESGNNYRDSRENRTQNPIKSINEPPADNRGPLEIETEMHVAVNLGDGANPGDSKLKHLKNMARPLAEDIISEEAHGPRETAHRGLPAGRPQDPPPVEPAPLRPTPSKEKNPNPTAVHGPATTNTEHGPPWPEVLPERVSKTIPTEAADGQWPESAGLLSEGALDDRIRTMVARLQGRPTGQPAKTGDVTDQGRAPHQLQVPPVPVESGKESVSHTSQTQQDAATSDRPPSNSGLLAPPQWLSELQTKFKRPWRENRSKTNRDPVVNVTIGRIEVRAVRAETPPKAHRIKKPSKVMSLDAYLNQRKERS